MGTQALETMMRNIVCVLKTGGWKNRHINVEYKAEQVRWLRDQIAEHVKTAHRFICLSDIEIDGVETRPLLDNLPGWWSKLELFREFTDNAFYIDLDTVIVKDITRLVKHKHKFTVLRNLSSKDTLRIGSGVMAWRGNYRHIYDKFMTNPDHYMQECTTSEKWGDQGFIQAYGSVEMERFQDLFPEAIKSYKFDLNRGDPNDQCRIVCFHGDPKPWQTNHSWVPKL